MSTDDMYEFNFFTVCYLNLYKYTTNVYECGIFVRGKYSKIINLIL